MHTTDLDFGQSVSSHPTMQYFSIEYFNRFQAYMFALYHENNSSYFFIRWSDAWPNSHAAWCEVRKDLHSGLNEAGRQCTPDLFLQDQAH